MMLLLLVESSEGNNYFFIYEDGADGRIRKGANFDKSDTPNETNFIYIISRSYD